MARRKTFAVISPSSYHIDFALRLVRRILMLAVVLFVALAAVGGGLTYYVITRQNSQEAVTPQSYLLSSYIPLNFTDGSGGEHEGWLLLGLRRAPVIILSHGSVIAGRHSSRQSLQRVRFQLSRAQGQGTLFRSGASAGRGFEFGHCSRDPPTRG